MAKPSRDVTPRPDGAERPQPRSHERDLAAVEGSPGSPDRKPGPSRRSLRSLDGFVFFVADVQTGFGPFVSVYLTTQKWTQTDIGLVLSIAGIVGLAGQVPGGILVDAAKSERLVAGAAVIAIALAAVTYASWPVFPAILAAAVAHAAASCVLGPAIAAISLGLVGHAAIGERLGRNSRFASIGNGFAAALMGAVGYFFAARSVFVVTAVLLMPTLFMLARIAPREISPQLAHGGPPEPDKPAAPFTVLLQSRPLLILAGCVGLFHLANAAMLPLMGSVLTSRSSDWATLLIAACIVVPQIIVALVAPAMGSRAQAIGRRPVLLLGFMALAARGLLFASVNNPFLVVAVQLLDGISAAALGVMVPLIVADITRGTGRFNSALGVIGTISGGGAALSAALAGTLTDHFGSQFAFLTLAVIAVGALLIGWMFVPETRPEQEASPPPQG